MRNRLFMHSIKNDNVLGRQNFVAKNENSQVYGKLIPDVMVNDAIKNSTAHQIYQAYSTGAAIPKKPRKGTKAANVPKKKDSFTANDNIITDDLDVALELGKSIIIRDTPSVSKKQNLESSMKLKGIELISDAVQLEIHTQKAVKASKRESRRKFQSRGSNKRAGIVPKVPDEPNDKPADSSEGAGTSPKVPDESKGKTSSNDEDDWDKDEAMNDDDKDKEDDKSIGIQENNDERTEFDNDDVEMADATKINADKYKELQYRAKQPTLDLDKDDMPMSREEEAKFMQTFHFDALLDEGSKILHSIKGTVLEEEIFFEFDKFIAMTADEIYDSESDTEEPPFEKITINTDYKIKTSLEEPPMDLELKPQPDNLEYVFLEEPSFLFVIISSQLSAQNKSKLVSVLKKHKEAFSWKTTDIPGICPSFCKHKIQLLDDKKLVV
ncbi:hypothetical protein Tco_0953796 [Tanacetum coccineum]|uniref:Reverse transcriptase domain-containing protein n=1 Tax=Tanacetum coccineum TaxID=301880 RepID=A0ABQ5E0W2_9ASTR